MTANSRVLRLAFAATVMSPFRHSLAQQPADAALARRVVSSADAAARIALIYPKGQLTPFLAGSRSDSLPFPFDSLAAIAIGKSGRAKKPLDDFDAYEAPSGLARVVAQLTGAIRDAISADDSIAATASRCSVPAADALSDAEHCFLKHADAQIALMNAHNKYLDARGRLSSMLRSRGTVLAPATGIPPLEKSR